MTRQVVSFTKRCADTGALLGEIPLDLPPRHLVTRAVWWTLSEEAADALAGAGVDLGGAAHAAEHASIGLLPLFATCDRWDIGGVSAARHPATGKLTVFVYDGHDGGAGFAERGFERRRGLAPRHQAGHRRLRLRGRLPLLRAVAEVRERQPPAVQARRGRAAGHAASRRRASRPGLAGTGLADAS